MIFKADFIFEPNDSVFVRLVNNNMRRAVIHHALNLSVL